MFSFLTNNVLLTIYKQNLLKFLKNLFILKPVTIRFDYVNIIARFEIIENIYNLFFSFTMQLFN